MLNINLTTTILSCILIFSSHLNLKSCNYSTLPPSLKKTIIHSEQSIRDALTNGINTPIEGIYKCVTKDVRQEHYIAIIEDKHKGYLAVFLHGASNYMDWKEGEEMGFIPNVSKYSPPFFYTNLRWFLPSRKLNTLTDVFFSGKNKHIFTLSFNDSEDKVISYIKESKTSSNEYQQTTPNEIPVNAILNITDKTPNDTENFEQIMRYSPNDVEKITISYGSSIALSQNGHIATNHHVIEDATSIKVIQYDRGDSILYKARLIYSDAQNDLAILKIEDSRFEELGDIPYSIATELADQGKVVFTLGYPKCEKLGIEIKLENGIINSLYGFKDDPKSYGTSINLLEGNSGGALFSTSGKLEGIVNARFGGVNNMSYAIKSQILVKILQKLSIPVPNQSSIAGLTFTEQVKKLKPFAFRIAAYK